MSWIKLDDRMPEHPKVVGLSDRAFRAHIEALCYCAGTLTDGLVTEAVAKKRGWQRSAEALQDAGLWEPRDDGWYIHDFLKHQRSKESAERLAEVRAESGKRGGAAKANAKQNASNLLGVGLTRSEEKRSEPQKPTASSVPRGSQKTITDDYRQQMHVRYAHVWTAQQVDERIAEALNHKAVLKAVDVNLYVNGWLRRDSERTTGGGTGAPLRGGYGQNRGASGVARVGASRREPPPIDLPPRPTNGAVQPRVAAEVPGAQSSGGYGGGTAAGGNAW